MLELTELTATQDRCQDTLTCPAVFEKDGKVIIIGKIVDIQEIAHRIGDGESAIEIDAGIVERALAGRNENISDE
jgi:hypothetical protein